MPVKDMKKYLHTWQEEHKEEIRKYQKEYRQKNKATLNRQRKKRYRNDPVFREKCLAAYWRKKEHDKEN